MNTIKKLFVVLFAFFVGLTSLFANPLPFSKDGEYVYYADLRNETPYYVGFMTLNSDDSTIFFVRGLNLETDDEFIFQMSFGMDENGEVDLKGIKGNFDLSNLVQQNIITDAFNFLSMYVSNMDDISYNTEISDTWDDGKTVYHFNKLFPVFKFTCLTYDGCGETEFYYADRFGMVYTNDELDEFFTFGPKITNLQERNLSVEIPSAKKKTVNLSGLKVTVDENWKVDNSYGQPGIWLKVSSIRDSQLMIETIPENIPIKTLEDQENFARILLLNTKGIFAPSITIDFDNGNLCMDYMMIDNLNVMNWQLLKLSGNKLINFSTYLDIYLANEEYYTNIIDSIGK